MFFHERRWIALTTPINTTLTGFCSRRFYEPREAANELRNSEARRRVESKEYVRSFDNVEELGEFFDTI